MNNSSFTKKLSSIFASKAVVSQENKAEIRASLPTVEREIVRANGEKAVITKLDTSKVIAPVVNNGKLICIKEMKSNVRRWNFVPAGVEREFDATVDFTTDFMMNKQFMVAVASWLAGAVRIGKDLVITTGVDKFLRDMPNGAIGFVGHNYDNSFMLELEGGLVIPVIVNDLPSVGHIKKLYISPDNQVYTLGWQDETGPESPKFSEMYWRFQVLKALDQKRIISFLSSDYTINELEGLQNILKATDRTQALADMISVRREAGSLRKEVKEETEDAVRDEQITGERSKDLDLVETYIVDGRNAMNNMVKVDVRTFRKGSVLFLLAINRDAAGNIASLSYRGTTTVVHDSLEGYKALAGQLRGKFVIDLK